MSPPEPRPDSRQAAVIDVGSNSVRLVIYRLEGRAIWTVYNEKALAGLGRDMAETGLLSPEGVEVALGALRRFRAILQDWAPDDIIAVATAAVREAEDGPAFADHVRQDLGLPLRVLSGEEEAYFAAAGVLAGHPAASGLVGDLGGSSLELVRIGPDGPAPGITLPMGPFALGAPRPLAVEPTRNLIADSLSPIAGEFGASEFHAVGGAWRNLGLLHMIMTDYPLRVAHQYEMSRTEALDLTRFVVRQSRSSLERIVGLSKKRYETLPYAALVLETLIEQLGLERIVVSAFGLREGLLWDGMSPDIRRRDPLLEGCEAMSAMRGLSAGDMPHALERWLGPAFAELEPVFGVRDPLLIAAACRLADLGGRLHPDHRAELAFAQVLRAPIAGMSHTERCFLALATFARHSASSQLPEPDTLNRVLSVERRARARALGAALRLGGDLSGRNGRLLAKAELTIDGQTLRLSAAESWSDLLLGEQTAKRAATLAGALKLKLVLA
ncbi:Ppx/GppA phosphatase family protein [Phenylobacterium sp.]|jgi:exopolyphosphatase/guanosine-5'-triphosphate,3'-diphosphate pyrophosphatase|uniref:Ppx/GppA phosphatase family protein n=1 Tax=Phenylobacterium sp. TaxID=1871053 RepID=UPI000C8F3449|nr:Ppx/GppA phosphatase family protein [Phenylobacterium sp.]MAK81667.1 exopolyphosphatase [Phenylobacterium sp.]|tara:strand:+ start:43077 stop:44573 length:1497 start_codon:yes stop_codon:yes gene_type:complete